MSAAPRFELLAPHHNRNSFDCGEESLNAYLQRYARQNAKRDYGITTVAVFEEHPTEIAAYYTLANSKIEPTRWPADLKKPPLDAPTILLARLAVDARFQGRGLGEWCLIHVFESVLAVAQISAVAALEVEALNERAARYYAHYGFRALQNTPHHLYLPTPLIRQYLAARLAP